RIVGCKEAHERADARQGNSRSSTTVPSRLENPAAIGLIWRRSLPVIVCCLLLSGCRSKQTSVAPSIEFTKGPISDEGGTKKTATIEGRVSSAQPGRRIVLFARSGDWYVQPFTDQPFTKGVVPRPAGVRDTGTDLFSCCR